MATYGVSVMRADESYGSATIYYNEAPTVYVEITAINSSNSKWRIRGRASLGDNETYLEGQGLGEFEFDSSNNKSYVFQIQNWNGDWVNTTNMYGENEENSIFNVEFDSSGGDDGGDDGGDSGGDFQYPDGQLYVNQGEGTILKVRRADPSHRTCWSSLDTGEPVYYYSPQDVFYIEVTPLEGYELDYYWLDSKRVPFKADNLKYLKTDVRDYYVLAYADNLTVTSTADGSGDAGSGSDGEDSGGDSGGDDSGDSGDVGGGTSGGSGSGTLYFDATQYGAQYAVEYSYDEDTFYIDSVKVKLAQYNSVWWAFNLTTKINDTVISSGSQNHFIDTWEWYDLGISGSADVTDEVEVSLSGSAIHNNYQFNVASPTSQIVVTGNSSSGGGGSSGDDDDDDGSGGGSGGSGGSGSDTATASGVTVKATWTTGPKVTLTITSLGGYNAGLYWRLKGRKSDGDENIYVSQTNSTTASFNQDVTKRSYTFQVCPNGTWTNDNGEVSIITVDFGESPGGDSGGGGGSTATARTLYLEQGEGTFLSILFSDSSYYHQWKEFKGNTSAVMRYNGQDTIIIDAYALDGYEADYYDVEGYNTAYPYYVENLKVYQVDTNSNGVRTFYYQLASDGDARIVTSATLVATARIYNENTSGWDRYAPYIYNENSGWERYTPYIYNENSGWERYS